MERPLTLTIAALGGQGGGVVMNWMVDVAQRAGYVVQATSVPGVAQRTGATIYYLEFALQAERLPVMALMPVPGTCDLIVASELVEAARMVQRKLVDPDITTVIASSHRTYTIDEKSHLGDGRANRAEILELLDANSARLVTFDMEAVASKHASVISAALLGGIAGAAVLPFSEQHYRQAIEHSGLNVAASLAAFEEALEATERGAQSQPSATTPAPSLDEVMALAVPRLTEYQSSTYADEYVKRVAAVQRTDAAPYELTKAVATGLALWMTYEDTIRVADLKTRPDRIKRLISSDTQAGISHVTEFMKPRVEEIAGSMPAAVGRWVLGSSVARRMLAGLTGGLTLRSSSVWGYLSLRLVARLRRFRPVLLRHQHEVAAINRWMDVVSDLAKDNYALAVEVARSQMLVAGYGETHERGSNNLETIMVQAQALRADRRAHEYIQQLREVALVDDEGAALSEAISAGFGSSAEAA